MNHCSPILLAVGLLWANGLVLGQCGPVINTFPHLEDFESGPVWVDGGTASDWAWGTPAHATINGAGGGVNSWCVGGLTGSFYNLGQQAYIESPCYDFSSLQYPWISFKIFWEVERQYDGMVLQYSLNGGSSYTNVGAFGDPVDCLNDNWYNEDYVNNLTTASPRNGWSGRIGPTAGSCSGGNGSGAWVTATHCMYGLAGASSVRFRFLFGAGTACNSYDGIGIDDVLIQNATPNNAAFTYTCIGNQVTFLNSSSLCPNVFAWDFGDPASGALNTSTVQNTAHTFSAAGTYDVSLTVSGPCNAPSTIAQTITIVETTITATDPQCIANSGSAAAVVSGGVGPFTYLWSPGGQTTASISGLPAGTYTVDVSGPNTCGSSATATLNPVASPLSVTLTNTDVSCASGSDGSATATVNGGTAPVDLLWSPGGQTTSSITGLSAAVYTVTISDGAGCQLDTTVTVDEPLPLTVTAIADASICSGASLTLTATSAGGTGAVSFAWSPAGPSVSPTVTTTYSVIATDANGCTSAADPVDVNVGNAITPIITNSLAQGCAPWCVDFSTVTAGVTFTWAYSDGASGSGASVSHCFVDAGSYDVTLTVTDADGCSGTLNTPDLVTVAPIPEASFVPAPSVAIISSPTFILNNTSGGGLNFVWSFGDPQGSTSTAPSPSITFSAVGCYTVELLATNDAGCADAERMELCVEDEFALYVPNTFTPNDDGLNDVFGVITSVRDPQAFELRVFDRWGGELWVSTDANTPWTGATVPDGVYAWTVNLLDATGKQRKQRGHVVLLR